MTPETLTPSVAALGLAIGLLFSLVCYLTTNLSPGGMITPGWLALTMIQDLRHAGLVLAATAVTYVGVLGLQKVVILYGKRLFAAVVLLGVLIQSTIFVLVQHDYPFLFTQATLGFVVPGLIAYQLVRQPKRVTLIAVGAVTLANYVVLASGILVGALPASV